MSYTAVALAGRAICILERQLGDGHVNEHWVGMKIDMVYRMMG